MRSASNHTSLIKKESKRLGFDFCGISKAEFLKEEVPRLEKWLKEEKHGKMQYMENYFDKRLDPRKLMPEAKSVISFLLNYFPAEHQFCHSEQNEDFNSASGKQILLSAQDDNSHEFKISKYAYGKDYHYVIKEKLKELIAFIKTNIGDVNARAFVDSAPVMDKVWAKKSGLGWIGKHSNLISKNNGSFFFIAELLVDLELEYDGPVADYCGTCTKCIDACPTNAISEPYVVDGSKCISYFTIEETTEDQADSYYHARPRENQIGAWASKQSEPLADRSILLERFEHYKNEFEEKNPPPTPIPRPPFWSTKR